MESPIEEIFHHEYCKFCKEEYELTAQKEFETRVGNLRPDFVTSFDGYLIAFECDGRDFHDEARDEIRDSILLGDEHVGTIYRFTGRLIANAPEMAIAIIAEYDPELFSERSIQVLKQKSSLSDFQISGLDHKRRSARRSYVKREFWRVLHRNALEQAITRIDDYETGEIPRL